jgi:hypothetical protein
LFLEDTEDAVEAAINLLDGGIFLRFLDDAGDAGVNNGCRTALLGD